MEAAGQSGMGTSGTLCVTSSRAWMARQGLLQQPCVVLLTSIRILTLGSLSGELLPVPWSSSDDAFCPSAQAWSCLQGWMQRIRKRLRKLGPDARSLLRSLHEDCAVPMKPTEHAQACVLSVCLLVCLRSACTDAKLAPMQRNSCSLALSLVFKIDCHAAVASEASINCVCIDCICIYGHGAVASAASASIAMRQWPLWHLHQLHPHQLPWGSGLFGIRIICHEAVASVVSASDACRFS
eukprot:scaffold308668_cov24-Tisochrysis_lutea.AAC.1